MNSHEIFCEEFCKVCKLLNLTSTTSKTVHVFPKARSERNIKRDLSQIK